MSLSSAKEFLNNICSDDKLFRKHKNAKSKEARYSIYRQYGYSFTDDELKEAIEILINEIKRRHPEFSRRNRK